VYVFVGPTLRLAEARAVLPGACFLPPVKAGDVRRVVERARFIGIIDGLYEQVPAVWHKEILDALSRGVRVYGGASLGALRAAELEPFGMVAVGRVARDFIAGALEDDDEVAVSHATAEHDFRPLSEAMVNLREGLERACAQAVISRATHDALVLAGKRRFYADRSWRAILSEGRGLALPGGELDALARFVEVERPDRKRDDALELLARLRDDLARDLPRFEPTFRFEPTAFWRAGRG
jgi:hypothetical protein